MAQNDTFDGLEDGAERLNDTLGATATLVAGFDTELRRMRSALAATGKDVATLEKGLSRGLRKAFDGVAFDGMKLSDALSTVARSMVNTTYNAAMKPVTDHVGGLISQGVGSLMQGILPFADGAPFSQGRVMPFAQGGIVSTATGFGMRGGMGLMGEAGPEAIMPLARGPDGKLGVKGGASGGTTVVMNITTPDVQGFQRSQSQIAAQLSRALNAGNRNR
ncbi:MAG: phage tail tape measure protein [Sulfitobacter litoralis]|jgi:phage-related minor tail protein|uniref:Phage tail tape measure protein n=2 Tax=root TaxID=1 RepID=A0A1H0PWQ5_9RHOB|nr:MULTISPECIES: phage tail tape measure protein [Sulfitobacter]MBQ0715936.1 phage tail tape measure protein [Sulfitobacter litoralis]MBQ0765688.1 phage tail tape measure protein [Sulfitobacter litoralis]MBQ0801740.1 phage tail tape measure protein [Sulfitobacter litoralis]MCF7726178.1 phage tail tape measure protein [Sulfitobacter sp. M22]MCF7777555.1 phage tail tape measure protein [Sulfitobacter sp. M220]|tara:strand:+ start:3527 stop:4186 length:660 start_codon:yes stop_codon:yes gene_type:complete